MVDIYMPVVECGYVSFFADVFSIYSCIVLIFLLKGEMPQIPQNNSRTDPKGLRPGQHK
jgi:hypothetical protein